MADENAKDAERAVRNRGLKEEDERLRDPDSRPPHGAHDTDASEPDRPATEQERNEEDIAHLENPPQSEGPRERSNDAV
jgi:hypothetical protein